MNTIEVMVAVEITASRRMRRLSRLRRRARSKAPTEPTEAASVGVAIPARIEPSTATISSSGGTRATTTSRKRPAFSDSGTGVAGADFGSSHALMIT
jgi:hypothetical protein